MNKATKEIIKSIRIDMIQLMENMKSEMSVNVHTHLGNIIQGIDHDTDEELKKESNY